MGLRVVHHLQPVLDLAVRAVKVGQFPRHLGRNPAFRRQRRKSPDRGPVAQTGVAPARDQLPRLGEELDLADAARAQLHIVALDHDLAVQPPVIADAKAHVMGVLDRDEVEVLAPDTGSEGFQEPLARCQITATGPRLDVGRTLPGPTLGLVIPFGGGHRQADRGDAGIGAQAQVAAEDVAIRRIRQDRRHPPGDLDEAGPRLLLFARIAGFVEQADEVDVRGIVKLSRPHLAHRKGHHPARRRSVVRGGTGQLAPTDLLGDQPGQRQMHRPVGQAGQGPRHRLKRPHPTQIAQRRQ